MKGKILYKILIPLDKLFMSFYRPKYIGLENIPKDESCVLAGNHTAKLDPLLLMSCTNRCIRYLAKIELCKGIKKHFFNAVGIIPVDRSKSNPEVIEIGVKYLKEGQVIGVFPEGTINKTKDIIMPFKYGAVKMAKSSDAYLVPFSITGKYKLFKKSITIKFDKPYKVKGEIDKENKKLENKVISLLKEKK